MDINNEMILMRKDIKKAKIHVISKLVRRVRLLKNKKGNDIQRQKHANHAQNLLDEIGIIKEGKADSIFKYLLSSNLTLEDVNKQSNMGLWDRACVRIGEIPFINQKMTAIRDRVNQFDTLRSDKSTSTSLKLVNKIVTTKPEKGGAERVRGGENNHPRLPKDEQPVCKKSRGADPDHETVETNADNNTSDIDNTQSNHDLHAPLEGDDDVTEHGDDDVTEHVEQQASQPAVAVAVEADRDPDSYATSIEVVLPDFYARPNDTSSEHNVKRKRTFDFSSSKSDDVSELLSNIGTGFFDSDDDITNNDDDAEAVTEEVQGGAEDSFFVSDAGTKIVNKRAPDTNAASHRAKVSSTFISSLSDVKVETPYRTKSDEPFCMGKKKNRLGQRRRKQKQHAMGLAPHDASATPAMEASKAKKPGAGKQNAPMHPSWVASQQRKQQTIIKEYSGTHVKFDDSD